MRLQCQMVVLIGSYLVFPNVDVLRVSALFPFLSILLGMTALERQAVSSLVSPVATPWPWFLRIEFQWRL